MFIGYVRVSKQDQNIIFQKDELKKVGCNKIFIDKITGTKSDRPGLNQAFKELKEGDTLVVWRLDRLARSLKDLIEIIGTLESKNIGFKSIHESIDTTTSTGKLIFHMFGALAEFERNLIRERTQAGLEAARARGRLGGRPKALNSQRRQLAIKLYKEKVHSVKNICQIMGISKTTLYRYLENEKEEKLR